MNKTILLNVILSTMLVLMKDTYANEISHRIIDIPEQKITSSGILSGEVIFSHIESFVDICEEECKKIDIEWTPLSGNKIVTPESEYLFHSGVNGIGIQIKIPNMKQNRSAQQHSSMEVNLKRTGNTVIAGELLSTPLLRRTVKHIDENGHVIRLVSENIAVKGKIVNGGCYIPHGQDLNITLPVVSQNQLLGIPVGMPLAGINGQTSIRITCEHSSQNNIRLYFMPVSSGSTLMNSSILPALDASGDFSGAGFIVHVNNRKVIWDGATPILIELDNESEYSLPIQAYYTRTGQDIYPGHVQATGLIMAAYQ
ncbi:fimbrial protein [Enterobacter sp. ECC-019]|uniref:fimbrial protein n=1 Tax=Enterobacter sp. ECC-019 TaxID=3116478 RepID=UPI00375489E9